MLWVLCDSNEYPQNMFLWSRYVAGTHKNRLTKHMFLWRTDKNYPSMIIKYPPYPFHCPMLRVLTV